MTIALSAILKESGFLADLTYGAVGAQFAVER